MKMKNQPKSSIVSKCNLYKDIELFQECFGLKLGTSEESEDEPIVRTQRNQFEVQQDQWNNSDHLMNEGDMYNTGYTKNTYQSPSNNKKANVKPGKGKLELMIKMRQM